MIKWLNIKPGMQPNILQFFALCCENTTKIECDSLIARY